MVLINKASYGKKVSLLISWGHWFTFYNIIAAILICSLFIFNDPSPETTLGAFYQISYWFSHAAFLTFLCYLLTVFPATLLIPDTRFIRGLASLVFTAALSLLILDALTYIKLGYHLSQADSGKVIALVTDYLNTEPLFFGLFAGAIVLAILAYELVMSNFAWKRLSILKNKIIAKGSSTVLVVLFFSSHLMHISADANLNFDILRQDATLPFSYPTTAKSLLTSYGLLDKEAYQARKQTKISLNAETPVYPQLVMSQLCEIENAKTLPPAILVLRDAPVSQNQARTYSRISDNAVMLEKHVDISEFENTLFNIFYGLPTLYKDGVINQSTSPVLFQYLYQSGLPASLIEINAQKENNNVTPKWFSSLFSRSDSVSSIESLIKKSSLTANNGLTVYLFKGGNDYQFDVFVNALLLAHRSDNSDALIWLNAIGNSEQSDDTNFYSFSMLFTNAIEANVAQVTNHMDILPTLMDKWLQCPLPNGNHSVGQSIDNIDPYRVIANTDDKGLLIFNKDMKLRINHNGQVESYSTALDTPLHDTDNYPVIVEGVNYIKRFVKPTNGDKP